MVLKLEGFVQLKVPEEQLMNKFMTHTKLVLEKSSNEHR